MKPSTPRPRSIYLSFTLLFLWLSVAALLAAGPTVTAPTPSPQAGFLGSTAQFSVTATGTGPFTYAWQHIDVGGTAYVSLSNGTRIAGATAATLQISSLQASDAGNYRCLVSNAGGQSNSGPGTLTVTAPPPPTVTRPANQTVTVGGTATFAVTVTGIGPFIYVWQQQAVGAPGYVTVFNGGRISGATGPTLQIASVQTSDAGNYRVLVSNGGGTTNPGPAILTVNLPPPPTVTAPSPASQTVTAGTSVTFSVSASGAGPFTYIWQYNPNTAYVTLNNGDRGGRISGANTAVLQIAATQATDTGSYRCLVTNAGGTTNPGPGTLTVNATTLPPAVTGPVPASQTIQVGASATVSVTATGTGPFTYAWQFNPGSGFVNVFNGDRGGRITINGGTLTLTNGQTSDTGSYRCLVTNAGGTTTSGSATVTVVQGTPQLTVKDPQGHTVTANQILRMLIPFKSNCNPTTAVYTISNAGTAPLTLSPPSTTIKQGTASFGATLSSTTVPANGGTVTLTVSFPCSVGFGDDFQRSGINLVSNAGNFSFDVSALWEMHFPEQGLQELSAAIESMSKAGVSHALELCDWRSRLHPDPAFPFGQPGASENLPVVAAAIALWAEPNSGGADYPTWWSQFLAEQLSPPGTAANDAAHNFQGSELMSFDYSAKVVAAITAVNAWTYTTPGAGAAGLRSSAETYLRATIGAYALAAGQTWARTAYGFYNGDAPDPNQIYSFVDGSDRPFVAGPYLALGGERSNSGYWSNDQRAHMFCHALGYNCTSAGRPSAEQQWQAAVVADAASKLPASASLFGLTANDIAGIQALVAESSGFSSSAASLLGGIRTYTTIHFLAWPGVRATCVETDTNTNTVPTLGGVYRVAPNHGTGQEIEFLYPFDSQHGRTDSGGGTCTVKLTDHVLQGSYTDSLGTHEPVIQLPTGTPLYHYKLGPDGFESVP